MSRLALYVCDQRPEAHGAGLIQCARHAQAAGERIVTACSEAAGSAHGRRQPILARLKARMAAGEFEAIVAIIEPEEQVVRLTLDGDDEMRATQ